MKDPRILELAHNLIHYSVSLKPGENILIEAEGGKDLVKALIDEAYKVGGRPFVKIFDSEINRHVRTDISVDQMKQVAKYEVARMSEMQAWIGIRAAENVNEMSSVSSEQQALYMEHVSHPVHHEIRVKRTNWCLLRWPNNAMAQLAQTSTEEFEDFYFKVCNLDYKKMDVAMDPLIALLATTDKVRIVAKDTDLKFSVRGMGSEKCSGLRNIPDGEVFTAPVKDSVNGVITYNTPSLYHGFTFESVRLVFKDGKVVEATSNNNEKINKIFDTDEGARYVGEFAFGMNPYITKPMKDTLFDEKISGSIHFTPGACYDEVDNGNNSAVHWDLVLIQTPEYGGGEIYFDDVLVRKDGRFVIAELEGLNPENLI
ncbi:MAG: aminopeptidase [Bacillota bacterium]